MADLKALIEHIARKHWEHGQGGQWEVPEGVNPADHPFPAYADDQIRNNYRAYATRLLEDAPILATVMQDEALRELLSHCRVMEASEQTRPLGSGHAELAYRDVADRLARLLDGES